MEFDRPVVELIRTRTSSRAYEPGGIDATRLQKLAACIDEASRNAPEGVRLALATTDTTTDRAAIKLGTYGFISGASNFIVGIVDARLAEPTAFGYLFETVILRATDLGLQTCWLGGTFNRSDFGRDAELRDGESIVVVAPAGTARGRRSARESVMRAAIGADRRKPWSEIFFSEGGAVPLDERSAGAYALPLEMVQLAPSASNKQPWRIVAGDGRFDFYLARTAGYGVTGFDLQRNDIGIAMCHFELAARELGLQGRWAQISDAAAPRNWEYVTSWSAED